ncbi:MAG: hypothetical protein WCG95_09465 [bacterium]
MLEALNSGGTTLSGTLFHVILNSFQDLPNVIHWKDAELSIINSKG